MNGEYPFPEAGRLGIDRDADVAWFNIEVEPKRGRRKARIYCHVAGCKTHVIVNYLTCQRHWRMAPKALRDQFTGAVKHAKTLLRMQGADNIERRFAISAVEAACLDVVNAIQKREIERKNHV